jgi:hypothetical protein
MPKKIYDIKPPKAKAEKIAKVLQDKKTPVKIKRKRPVSNISNVSSVPVFAPVSQMETPVTVEPMQRMPERRMPKKSAFWPIFSGICAVVLIIGIYLFFTLPKVDIAVWPKVDTLSYQQAITADKSAPSIDSTNKIVPAQYFQASKTASQDFPATGNASNEGFATGTITIYNKVNPPETFNFKVGTHFMSDSGKLFIATGKIAIPAATKSGSKITPGTVQVQVKATESGDAYNVAPSNFSIPGLKGTDAYYSIYAVSTKAMAGGYSGQVKKVTDDDIQGAKDALTKKATGDAISALKSQIPADYVVLDNAINSAAANSTTSVKSGAVAQNFNSSVTVTASALAFKKADLEQFAKKYLVEQMSQSQTILDNSFKLDYTASKVDISGGKETLNLNFSAGAYQSIDVNSLSLSVLGQNAEQIKNTIDSLMGSGVSKVQVNFWPFWVNSAPKSQGAVHVQLKF